MKIWEISSLLSFPKKNQRNAVSKTKTWSQPNYGIQRLALRTGPWNRPSIWVHLHTILSGIKRWIRRNHQILCSTSKYPHFLVAKKKLWFLQPETLKPIPPNRKNPWKPLKHEKKTNKKHQTRMGYGKKLATQWSSQWNLPTPRLNLRLQLVNQVLGSILFRWSLEVGPLTPTPLVNRCWCQMLFKGDFLLVVFLGGKSGPQKKEDMIAFRKKNWSQFSWMRKSPEIWIRSN